MNRARQLVAATLWVWGWAAFAAPLVVPLPTPSAERDPTQPPAALLAPRPSSPSSSGDDDIGTQLSILRVNGKPHIMWGSRLLVVGDKLGRYRIERIADAEVWLRDGKELKKIKPYANLVRQVSPAAKE